MLKKIFLTFTCITCLCAVSFAAKRRQRTLPTTAPVMTFTGTVQKVGFFEKLSIKWIRKIKLPYVLCQGKERIVFLTHPKNNPRIKQQLEKAVGHSVRIKGTREFIPVEPYFLVTVKDVCIH